MPSDEKRSEEYRNNINKVDVWVTTASENGLFDVQSGVSLNPILDKLKNARDDIEKSNPPNFSQCDYDLSLAASNYFKAVNETPAIWRFLNIYAGHLWIYLVAFLSIVFIFYSSGLSSSLSVKLGVPQIAVDATAWGVIGGLLRGIWWLWKNVNLRQYRKAWIIWFISTPFLGGILGAIVYLTIFAGLLVISQDTTMKTPNSLVVIVLCALAGFNWDWAVERFKSIGEKLSS